MRRRDITLSVSEGTILTPSRKSRLRTVPSLTLRVIQNPTRM